MAQARSTKDLIKLALQHAGELNDGTSEFHQLALTYINRIYKDLFSGSNPLNTDIGERWVWARERIAKSLILEPEYTTGTVSLTNGSTAGTFSTPPSFSAADRYLKIESRPTYYRILTHVASASAFTIDANYVEVTGGTLAFKAIPIIVNLGSDICRLVEPMRIYDVQSDSFFLGDEATEGKIYSTDINTFRTDYPLKALKQGIPTRFAIIHESETELLVQFNAHPSKQVKVDFDWITFPTMLTDSDDSIPLVPFKFREVLSFGSAYYILKDKTDDKAETYLGLAQAGLLQMKKAETRQASDTDKNYGKLKPRQEQLDRFVRRFTTAR